MNNASRHSTSAADMRHAMFSQPDEYSSAMDEDISRFSALLERWTLEHNRKIMVSLA